MKKDGTRPAVKGTSTYLRGKSDHHPVDRRQEAHPPERAKTWDHEGVMTQSVVKIHCGQSQDHRPRSIMPALDGGG